MASSARRQSDGGSGARPARGHGPNTSSERAVDAQGRAGFVERVAAQAVAQGHRRDAADMAVQHLRLALQRGKRAGRADQGQFAAQPVRAEMQAEFGGAMQGGIGGDDAPAGACGRR